MAHDRPADDDLPPLMGSPLPARAPEAPRRAPRTWRLRRVATLLLVLLLIVTGSLQKLATDYARSLVRDRIARESTDDRVTGSASTDRTEAFAYDELNRLIETSGAFVSETGYDAAGNRTSVAYGPGGVNGTDTFAYDENGNRASQTSGGVSTTYAFDDADRLTTVNGVATYTYDDNGNRLTATDAAFQYDWRDRLISADDGAVDVDYAYDGEDRRVARTEGSTTTEYAWDTTNGLPVVTEAGGERYVHGPAGIAVERSAADVRTYPTRDGQGSVRGRTDADAAVVGTTDYDAWGYGRGSSGQQGTHGYTGEPTDPDTGLVHLRARDYSPGQGRFVQADDVRPNGAATQGYAADSYAYADNNPTSRTDPTGRMAYAGTLTSTLDAVITTGGHAPLLTFRNATTAGALVVPAPGTPNAQAGQRILQVALILRVIRVALNVALAWYGACGILSLCDETITGVIKGIAELIARSVTNIRAFVRVVSEVSKRVCRLDRILDRFGVKQPALPGLEFCERPCPKSTVNRADRTPFVITITPRSDWDEKQLRQAFDKVQELNRFALSGNAQVVHRPQRGSEAASGFDRRCKPTRGPCEEIDHIVDLAVGGQDIQSNLQYLDSSVNRSIGAQIGNAIRCKANGTRVISFTWLGAPAIGSP